MRVSSLPVFPSKEIIVCLFALLWGQSVAAEDSNETNAAPFLVVLGISQDGGTPQAGTTEHPGWEDDQFKRRVVSLALVDPGSEERWLFETTPDFRAQLHHLDQLAPATDKPGLTGIFLTHAHIGHYTGLMFLGHESMGAKNVPVFAMPRMQEFLSNNGPWSQLVKYENVALRGMENGKAVRLNSRLSVTAFLVPHRQEFTEVVGFRIDGPNRSVIFIPDIDSWEEWDEAGTRIEDMIASVDVAYLDGSFFANGEIPGRDMSGFPHPFITHSMQRFSKLPAKEKSKIRFIHLNHTNPAIWPGSDERAQVLANGYGIADEGEIIEL